MFICSNDHLIIEGLTSTRLRLTDVALTLMLSPAETNAEAQKRPLPWPTKTLLNLDMDESILAKAIA